MDLPSERLRVGLMSQVGQALNEREMLGSWKCEMTRFRQNVLGYTCVCMSTWVTHKFPLHVIADEQLAFFDNIGDNNSIEQCTSVM